jgi:FkbM family methyltransferase
MSNKIFQLVYNSKLEQTNKSFSGRIKNRIVNLLFNLIKKQNPLIEVYIGKYNLTLPFSHQLPFIIKLFPNYSTNLARIAKEALVKYNNLKLIDIGANIGDSVALLRSEADFPILCIEGDNYFFDILEENVAKFTNIYLSKCYVGETTEKINAISVEIEGTASLVQNESKENLIDIKNLVSVVEEFPLFKDSKIIKIDTDGFDNKIIRGSKAFIESAKPIIFFEYDPYFLAKQDDDGISIFSFLIDMGYDTVLLYENNGDFIISSELKNTQLLEDITNYYTGRQGKKYCDICTFHKEDRDLFVQIRNSEIIYFNKFRS